MSSQSSRPRPVWIWPLTVVLLFAMAIAAFLYVFQTIAGAPRAAVEEGRRVLEDLQRVAAAFKSGTVTTSFASYATEATGVNRLQVAELRQMELFERTDAATVLWGQLQLPDVVVRARAPVEYTYWVDLDGAWDFRMEGQRIRVYAPKIQFSRPAVDVSGMRYEVAADSLLRDEALALERLRAGITEMSRLRAADNVELIRELARRETAEFVRRWLAARFVDGDDFTVEVLFADESPLGLEASKPEL